MPIMRRVVAVACVLLAACGSETTPQDEFCDEAVPLLSQEHDLTELEPSVRGQMEELTRLAEMLPADQEEELIVLIDDLAEQYESVDGWSSQDVVEYVGSLCERNDLTWSAAIT